MLIHAARADPQDYDDLLEAARAATEDARWWLPSLVHLATAREDLPTEARDTIATWAATRHECWFMVVQEETDEHLSLTASAWPLVDDRGRLRFPIGDDPIEVHTERHELQAFVDAHRDRWHDLGLVGPEQAAAPIHPGDTFALRVERVRGRMVVLHEAPLHRPTVPTELYLSPARSDRRAGDAIPTMDVVAHTWPKGRRRRRRLASTTGPVVDITWDARQAGKVAQLAAFSGVLASTPGSDLFAASGDDALIAEGLDRQLEAFLARLPPDDALTLDDESGE